MKVAQVKTAKEQEVNKVKKPSWIGSSNEEKDNFKNSLGERLAALETPDCVRNCKDVHCKDPSHSEALDSYAIEILSTIEIEATRNLKVIEPKPRYRICQPFLQFLDPEIAPFLRFLDPEI